MSAKCSSPLGSRTPTFVPVLSAGELDGRPYYTMPYVDGASLRARLEERRTLSSTIPTDDAVAILFDVARALAYAHARGIVHRDIKPENVLLAGDTAVVTDFGIAKALQTAAATPGVESSAPSDTTALTRLGTVIGTPGIDAELARRDGMRRDRGRSVVSRAAIAAHLGDTDRAIDLLTRGLTEGGIRWSALTQARAVNLAVDPMFLPLRAEPRYRALLDADPADIR